MAYLSSQLLIGICILGFNVRCVLHSKADSQPQTKPWYSDIVSGNLLQIPSSAYVSAQDNPRCVSLFAGFRALLFGRRTACCPCRGYLALRFKSMNPKRTSLPGLGKTNGEPKFLGHPSGISVTSQKNLSRACWSTASAGLPEHRCRLAKIQFALGNSRRTM